MPFYGYCSTGRHRTAWENPENPFATRADSVSDLPAPDYFTGFRLVNGFRGITSDNGKEYIMDSSGTWHEVIKSYFENVYTKSEIDTMLSGYYTKTETDNLLTGYYTKTETDNLLSPIQSDLNTVIQANAAQDPYLYALIGQSTLNYLDSSIWNGQTTAGSGYICQDLAINLPAGTYIWKMQRDGNTSTSFVLKAADNTELYRVNRGAGVNDITQEFTISADAAKISIYAGYSVTYHDNMIFKKLT